MEIQLEETLDKFNIDFNNNRIILKRKNTDTIVINYNQLDIMEIEYIQQMKEFARSFNEKYFNKGL
ncbi:MAG TPA: hypothetical protein PLN85_02220 [archaeon]|nr:hypothetical protein [archaeon]HRT03406.1 hypothetical protein [Candidatus Diapherotrites archaeon]